MYRDHCGNEDCDECVAPKATVIDSLRKWKARLASIFSGPMRPNRTPRFSKFQGPPGPPGPPGAMGCTGMQGPMGPPGLPYIQWLNLINPDNTTVLSPTELEVVDTYVQHKLRAKLIFGRTIREILLTRDESGALDVVFMLTEPTSGIEITCNTGD